jgi:hypothetical protein
LPATASAPVPSVRSSYFRPDSVVTVAMRCS